MCGRYLVTMAPEMMAELFGFIDRPNFPPRYNIAPTQPVPVIRLDEGVRRFHLMRWGLIPSWSRASPASLLINARAETLADKPSFRGAFRHHRALMPADGFYEWQTIGAGGKQPHLIRRRDGAPFAMASVSDRWLGADGSEIDSCAVVTTAANATLAPIHHRMPVILAEEDWARWLDPATTTRDLLALLRPAASSLLEAIPVSARVNKVAHNDPDLIQPVATVQPQPDAPDQMDLF